MYSIKLPNGKIKEFDTVEESREFIRDTDRVIQYAEAAKKAYLANKEETKND